MGLIQKAYETYDALADQYVGNYDEKEVMAPVSHIITSADIQITLDLEGRFISAEAIDKDEPKIIIPATEKSAGRTSGAEPHPLCDQVGYLSGEDARKKELYIAQLKDWVKHEPHPTLKAVLAYAEGGTITDDLTRAGLLQWDDTGKIRNNKMLIRWRILGSPVPDCWKDQSLFKSFIRYYRLLHETDEKNICMLNGQLSRTASQHPKGIVAQYGNAKLISANDLTGFTYRGRFTADNQALTLGYEASQKAQAALRWVIANQGITCEGRTFVCWNPQGIKVPSEDRPFLLQDDDPVTEASDYYYRLRDTLRGWQTKLPPDSSVVIAAFDAATPGRLALTYYNELYGSDFLERLYAWDASCCWWNGQFGIQSPALFNIISFAFKAKLDERPFGQNKDKTQLLKQHMQRLIACRVEGADMPLDIVRGLAAKCHNLQLYDNPLREKLLFTACAVIHKYYTDKKEELSLSLEPERKDRSYQYGRLLAVLEKAEQDTYDRNETRITNAIRMQPMFVRNPLHTSCIIIDQLKKAYYPKLHPAVRLQYERIIGEILNVISDCPKDSQGEALADSYLLGYYLQKKELYSKQNRKEE